MACLFFGLVIAPCSDGHTCDEEENTMQHDHSHDEKDDCTPLCMCSCCGVTYTIPNLIDFEFTIYHKIQSSNWNYTNNYAFSFGNSIWHPPTDS